MTTLKELLTTEQTTAKAPIDKKLVKPVVKDGPRGRLRLGETKDTSPATVDDEIANLLGGKKEPAGNEIAFPALENPAENSNAQLEALLGQPIHVTTEINGELEAPAEFAHAAQVEKFDSSSVETLRASLEVLQNNINDKEIVGDAVYNLMINLQKDEKFRDQLSDADLGLMVAGMRAAYGVTVQRKQNNKKKRTSASTQAAEVASMLDGLTF